MPFQSEAQRRYLWANEPEIARDWTDTYGSRIEAALGGIMRLGFYNGGPGPGGQGARGQATQNPGRGGGDDARGQHIQNQIKTSIANLGAPPGQSTSTPHMPTQPKGFWSNLGTNIQNFNPLDYAPFVGKKSLSGMLTRGIGTFATDLFKGPKEDPWNDFTKGNPHLEKKVYDFGPTGGDGQQQQYPPWLYDAYAQNIVGDEELDIDTSTGNLEDWSQRFRVKDPYRQDRGGLDEQIKEYVSKLYTTP
jgi:hypothetical protein